MLELLHIVNIAVIEEAEIRFGPGFNVLTGETGAGKSIVIDAICAILGERTYRDVIRTGADKASVTALFSQIPDLPWFQENNVTADRDSLTIQRDIYADGKNLCRVNGKTVTVSVLKKLGQNLINIHGQHDSQQLFDEANHLRYLDLFGANEELLAAYHASYEAMISVRKEIQRLTMDEGEKLRRMEMLQYQIEEIRRAQLRSGEDETLENRRRVLQNAEKMEDAMTRAAAAVYGDENRQGVSDLADEAYRALSKISRFDTHLEELCHRMQDLMYNARDIGEELRDMVENLTYSGEELEQIEGRLDTIYRLRRKYGGSVDHILAYYEKAMQELDEIRLSDDRIVQLEHQLDMLSETCRNNGLLLRKARKSAADTMKEQLTLELAELDMPKAQFACQLEPSEMDETGMDHVRFLMTANVGEALKPMSKVASGGELARIMLAIKNVLAQRDHVETMIFDEVDAGVSGRAAQKVAKKLRSVSHGKQVLCVTHLPQIAAAADRHLLICKTEESGRTYTRVQLLDRSGRANEIARIIGGAEITETTLRSAEEMLFC